MKTVYKIVRRDLDRNLISGYSETATLTYKVKETTKPSFGRIFAFDNLADALDYARSDTYGKLPGDIRIYKASCPETFPPPEFIGFRNTELEWLRALWNDQDAYFSKQIAPKGTVCCDELTLLQPVSKPALEKANKELRERAKHKQLRKPSKQRK